MQRRSSYRQQGHVQMAEAESKCYACGAANVQARGIGGGVAGGELKKTYTEINSYRAFQAVTSVLRDHWKSL